MTDSPADEAQTYPRSVECPGCKQRKELVVAEASVPCDDGVHEYEVSEHVTICRICLREDIGTLARFLSGAR